MSLYDNDESKIYERIIVATVLIRRRNCKSEIFISVKFEVSIALDREGIIGAEIFILINFLHAIVEKHECLLISFV
jgi:hypothetical protein